MEGLLLITAPLSLAVQLEVERTNVQRLEQEQATSAHREEESLSQQQRQLAALRLQLQEEVLKVSELRVLLQEEERRRAGRAEAQWEAELQQAKARWVQEEARSCELERQLEELKKKVTEGRQVAGPGSKVNGHKDSQEAEESEENGGGAPLLQPLHHPQSPSSPASSPVMAKRHPGPALLPSSYQAGVNQRFQAARHKFQSQAELEQQQLQLGGGALSPRDLSPVASPPPAHLPAEQSAARQLARHTVTQVLSRFTGQQGALKLPAVSSSPFGTDYRNLATGGRSPSSPGPLPPPLASRSALLSPASRADKTPPPAPPKKPGMMSPGPGSPSHCSSSSSHFPELTGNCGHAGSSSGADGAAAVTSQS